MAEWRPAASTSNAVAHRVERFGLYTREGYEVDEITGFTLDRREAMSLLGAALAAGSVDAQATESAPQARGKELLDRWGEANSRLDGKPVFWLTRGREYTIAKGRVTAIYDRHIVTASQLIRTADGGFKRPYTETAFATMPGSSEFTKELTSPLTGKAYPNPIIRPGRLTLYISPEGKVTQEFDLAKPKVKGTYSGQVSSVNSATGAVLPACIISAIAITESATVELTEMGPYHPDIAARDGAFVPTKRDVIVVREAPAYLTGGSDATMVGIHPSVKYPSIQALRKVLTPVEREVFAPWFNAWEGLLKASEDIVVPG